MGSISDRLQHDVEGWKPQAGEEIVGTVIGVDTRPSDYGDDYPYLEVELADGRCVAVHAFHSVLKREISRLAPKMGDEIGIKYFGKVDGRNQQYEKYRVIVESSTSEAPTPDWDAMQKSAEAEAADAGAPATHDEEPF